MANSYDKDQDRPANSNNDLNFDDWISILVAFSTIGAILFWAIGKNNNNLGVAPQAIISPSPNVVVSKSPNPINQPLSKAGQPKITNENNRESSSQKPTVSSSESRSVPAKNNQDNIPIINPASPEIKSKIPNAKPKISEANSIKTESNQAPVKVVNPLTNQSGSASVTQSDTQRASEPVTQTEKTQTTKVEKPSNSNSGAAIASGVEITDVPDEHWAKRFIMPLVKQGIINGVNNGKFEPDRPVKRAELASILHKVFPAKKINDQISFKDISADHWAYKSIRSVATSGFLKGFPKGTFEPDQPVPKAQLLGAIVNGLDLNIPARPRRILRVYKDAQDIPQWAIGKMASATKSGLVVTYPDRSQLNPNEPTTRAEVAAILYQTLVLRGKATPIESNYIVKPAP